jgi:hypothetical protein
LGRQLLDSSVDRVPIRDHRGHQPTCELGRLRVTLGRREMALEDRRRRSLAELRLEHRGERESAGGAFGPMPVRA